jgi:nucleoid-associated protein YgaU
MSDHLSDPPPYEPPPPEEDFYEWENEDQGPRPNVLWTRIVALIVGLLLVFFLGRLTAGGDDGGDDAELTSLRQQNAQLEGQVTDLQNELDAAQAEQDPEPTETPPEGEGEGEGEETGTSTETYTVQAGQGFQQIAEDALGDIGLAECIAEFNGLTLDSTITPGEELDIPAAEDC